MNKDSCITLNYPKNKKIILLLKD